MVRASYRLIGIRSRACRRAHRHERDSPEVQRYGRYSKRVVDSNSKSAAANRSPGIGGGFSIAAAGRRQRDHAGPSQFSSYPSSPAPVLLQEPQTPVTKLTTRALTLFAYVVSIGSYSGIDRKRHWMLETYPRFTSRVPLKLPECRHARLERSPKHWAPGIKHLRKSEREV